ncbi:MAG: DnaJ domain-containing protein [Planctomycetaceae bacterium]|nr:DnaJ domain-containing protein [Planctomycetaceae bacterium]
MNSTPTTTFSSTGEIAAPPREFDPFALLGIERRASLDPETIRPAYLKACREVHPDRFQDKGGEQLERAKAWTALYNKAYSTLKDNHARLTWLLEAEGFPNPLKDAKGSAVPQSLLMEMFELQEMLDEAESGSGVAPNVIKQAQHDLMRRQSDAELELSRIAEQWDVAGSDHTTLARHMGELFSEERYYERLLTRMNSVLEAYNES